MSEHAILRRTKYLNNGPMLAFSQYQLDGQSKLTAHALTDSDLCMTKAKASLLVEVGLVRRVALVFTGTRQH